MMIRIPVDHKLSSGAERLPLALFENAAIRLRDRRMFKHTNWEIGPGQHWLVTGPNGAGKSTLARALVGQLPIVQGRLSFPGLKHPQTDIGYMAFERHRQLLCRRERLERARYFSKRPALPVTGRDALMEWFQNSAADWRRLRQVLSELDAPELLDRPLGELSSGEIQKLLLAQSLNLPARLLVLDEPYAGLDRSGRSRLNRILASRLDRTQVVLITQRTADIPHWITHEMVVHDCRVAAAGKRHLPSATNDAGFCLNRPPPPVVETAPEPNSGGEAIVELKDVTVSFGRRVILNGLSWRMADGENWAVLGPNGSGKTTLLSLITADHPQAYGNDIFLFGRRRGSGESIWDLKQCTGLVSSEMHRRYQKAVPTFEVVLSGYFDSVGLYRSCRPHQRDAARRWMRFFGLSDLSQRPFTQLSYGQQRLVLIARAMVKSPALLVLDEPCQGLDADNRVRVLDLLDTLGRRNDTQLLYVTHHQNEMLPCIHFILRLIPSVGDGFTGVYENGPASR